MTVLFITKDMYVITYFAVLIGGIYLWSMPVNKWYMTHEASDPHPWWVRLFDDITLR